MINATELIVCDTENKECMVQRICPHTDEPLVEQKKVIMMKQSTRQANP